MTEHYETTRSRGEAPLKLIFPAGGWDSLPFEVRLSRHWYGSEVCRRDGITTHQLSEIARQGYCIAAVEPAETDKPSIGNFKSRSATSRILIPILGAVATTGPNCANGGRSVDELSSGQLKGDHEGLVKVLDGALVCLTRPGDERAQ
jgi:hypothetical protein